MLTLLFIIILLGLCGSVFRFTIGATWGIIKFVLILMFLPLIISVFFVGGVVFLALPVLLILGAVALLN